MNKTVFLPWAGVGVMLIMFSGPKIAAAGVEGKWSENHGEITEKTKDDVSPALEKRIEELIEKLRAEKSTERYDAAIELEKIGQPAVKPLILLLNDENNFVRTNAVMALGTIGDKKAVSPLICMLKDRDAFVRREAALSLGKMKDGSAVVPLARLLKDEDPYLRCRAAEALRKIGDGRAVFFLIDALRDEYWCVRSEASQALAEIGGDTAVGALLEAMEDKDRSVRYNAAFALGNARDPRAAGELVKALKDDDETIRCRALEALGKIADAKTIEHIAALLEDDDADVRRCAVKALGKFNNERAVHNLVACLTDRHINDLSAEVLENSGWQPESVSDRVHYFVARKDKSRLEMMWTQTKKVLLKDVESGNYRAIENALYAFIGIGREEIIGQLIDALNARGTKTTAEAYLNCGNKKLRETAVDWAFKHGYNISSGTGAHSAGWGNW